MSYIIGSFNLRDFNFANKSSDGTNETIQRDYDLITKIIIKEKFDVVALQEVNAELPLNHLTENYLNKYKNSCREYKCSFGEDMPNLYGSKDPERYGFIWNAKRLRLLNLRRGKNPGYYQNAKANTLIRPPYYARFTARDMLGGSNFELRLVNTHIVFGTQEKDRIEEFNILVKQVLPRICDHQEVSEDGEMMPAYTFLLGDYNLALNKSERSIYRIDNVTDTNYTGKWRSFRTIQDEKTTLIRNPTGQESLDMCYANNYDHFTYEDDLGHKLRLTPERVEALTKYFPELTSPADKLNDYRNKVSDHVPIKLTVDLQNGGK